MQIMSAAFGRLRVETLPEKSTLGSRPQPPSGGCVLKRRMMWDVPPRKFQPPSGGCVLKQSHTRRQNHPRTAAFGRLRVETTTTVGNDSDT